MKKILLELLKLLWKLFKVVFWRWIRPVLGKVILVGVLVLFAIAALGVLIAGAC